MKGAEPVVRRSVLDRLLQTGEPEPRTPAESARARRQAVLRDVEWLLNTRRIAVEAPAELVELRDSVYHYGLPDVTSVSADSHSRRRDLLRQVEATLTRFEPRLTSIRVIEAPQPAEAARAIRFSVEAMLRLEGDAEPIYFDTVLDAASGSFNIAGG
jgi:type VI secretion system protein ImpF